MYVFFSLYFLIPFFLTLFVVFFYRDPKRIIKAADNEIISPADGKVLKISKTIEHHYFKEEVMLVRIFLSVFNVHVNRSPISSCLALKKYFPGKHLVAFNDKASEDNERSLLIFKNDTIEIGVMQIAGLLARRIVNWAKVDSELRVGEKYGMIKLGSCVEVYMPSNSLILVKEGDKVRGGQTVIGKIPD